MKRGIDYIGVGVGAVIINERHEVLLLLRRVPPEPGYWTIPGGAVELFESCEEAIVRECREEVNLSVHVDKLLTIVDHIVREEATHWVAIEYLVTVNSGVATNAEIDENQELKWFPLDRLPERMTQPTRQALDVYKTKVR